MKIALVIPGFSANESDWCIPVVLDVVKELSHASEVHVFALRYPFQRHTYRVHGVTVHALGGGNVRGMRRAHAIISALAAIAVEHSRGRFDVFHGLWADEPGFVATLVGHILRRPSIVSIMGGELANLPEIGYGGYLTPSNRILTSWSLRAADVVTAASGKDSDTARNQRSSVPRNAVQRLVWGVDPAIFNFNGSEERRLAGAPRILHVASLVPVKDQSSLLLAFRHVRHMEPDAHLHIVGLGPLRGQLEHLVDQLELRPAVTFHGEIRRESLPSFYRQADLFVLSSRHEQQPAVVLEALLCGCPVAGTNVGIMSELADSSAVLVAPADPTALATAILDALNLTRRRVPTESLGFKRSRLEYFSVGADPPNERAELPDQYLAVHTTHALLTIYEHLPATRLVTSKRTHIHEH